MDNADVIVQALSRIVGPEAISEVNTLERSLRQSVSLAMHAETLPRWMVSPATQEELAEVVACAAHHGWPLLPIGSGSKIAWGGLASQVDLLLNTSRLNRLIDHAIGDLTVTVEAGMNFQQLQVTLQAAGQFLGLDPHFPDRATLAGIVATADTRSLRQRYGGVRDRVIGISLVRSDGQLAKAGGRVVKNVAGYDLMKLLTGSYGSLGVISQLTLRLYPLPPASRTIMLTGTAEALIETIKVLLGSALTPTAVDLLSPTVVQTITLKRQPAVLVRFQSLPESVQQQSDRLLELGQSLHLQGICFEQRAEADLWQQLRTWIELAPDSPCIACKLAVKSSEVVSSLMRIDELTGGYGVIHAGSGIGWLQVACDRAMLQRLRTLCQSQAGYLIVLAAPTALKQSMDIWGYAGNAFELMRQIKQQFDPQRLISPARFVGGL